MVGEWLQPLAASSIVLHETLGAGQSWRRNQRPWGWNVGGTRAKAWSSLTTGVSGGWGKGLGQVELRGASRQAGEQREMSTGLASGSIIGPTGKASSQPRGTESQLLVKHYPRSHSSIAS